MRAFAAMIFGLLLVLQQSLAFVPAAGRTPSAPCRCCCHCAEGCACVTDSEPRPASVPGAPLPAASDRDGWLLALAFAPVADPAPTAAPSPASLRLGWLRSAASPLYQQHCSYLI